MTDTKKNSALADPVPAKMTDAEIAYLAQGFWQRMTLAEAEKETTPKKFDITGFARAIESRALSSAAGPEPVAWMWRYVGDDPIGHQLKPCARALHEMDPNNPPYPKHWQPEYALYPAPVKPQEQPVAAQKGDGLAKYKLLARFPSAHAKDVSSNSMPWWVVYLSNSGGHLVGSGPTECDAWNSALAFMERGQEAPQQEAGQARELPPLPAPYRHGGTYESSPFEYYTADQMREYARAAQSAPAVPDEREVRKAIKALPSICWWHPDGYPVFNNANGDDLILRKDALACLASAPAQPTVPEGFALVPKRPTQEMCDAFNSGAKYLTFGDCYARMIAAAAPVAQQGSKG